MTRRITVATSNLQAHMRLTRVARSVRKVKRLARPDLWGFQEIGGRHKWLLIRVVLGHRYAGARLGGDAAEVPVAWRRRRFRLVRKFAWHLSDPTPVGHAGPGPARLRGKSATVVVLLDRRSNKHVVLFNDHLAPSPQMGGQRAVLHGEQVLREAALVKWIKAKYPDADVFDVGDKNARDANLLKPVAEAGLHLGPNVPTHGPHAYDRIISNVPHRMFHAIRTFSDHDTLVGKF